MKFEVSIVPVSDVDRAKEFYTRLGWRLDDDIVAGDTFRVVQLTPPGSASSISFGKGLTPAKPGSFRGGLIVSDIIAAQKELVARGHPELPKFFTGRLSILPRASPGPDPERKSYSSYSAFEDPRRQRLDRSGSHPTRSRPRPAEIIFATELTRPTWQTTAKPQS